MGTSSWFGSLKMLSWWGRHHLRHSRTRGARQRIAALAGHETEGGTQPATQAPRRASDAELARPIAFRARAQDRLRLKRRRLTQRSVSSGMQAGVEEPKVQAGAGPEDELEGLVHGVLRAERRAAHLCAAIRRDDPHLTSSAERYRLGSHNEHEALRREGGKRSHDRICSVER